MTLLIIVYLSKTALSAPRCVPMARPFFRNIQNISHIKKGPHDIKSVIDALIRKIIIQTRKAGQLSSVRVESTIS